jgi:DNA-3-methyladenine glycosylase II
MHSFTVTFSEPIDLVGSLAGFARSGDDLIDRFNGSRLVRTVPVGAAFVPYMCDIVPGLQTEICVTVGRPEEVEFVRPQLEHFVVTAPPEWPGLVESDAVLTQANASFPGIRNVRQHHLLTALVRSVSAQQINLRWASTIRARLAERYGDKHSIGDTFVYSLNASRLAEADADEIRALQFTTRKAQTVIDLARSAVSGELSLENFQDLPSTEVIERLVEHKGIGVWSAEWILARTMGRPVVVAGDLGVRKAIGRAYLNGAMPSEAEVRELTAHWGTCANVAQAVLLHSLAVGT